ncbi:hypothetical protein IEQ_04917 [Bacillus cereus BAG6X1-2]|nr:hypothetical protein IEQ_04917 [Bacillus cereus BAG6X1-2]
MHSKIYYSIVSSVRFSRNEENRRIIEENIKKGEPNFVIRADGYGECFEMDIEKVEQKDFNLKDKEIEIYKEMKKEGYHPIQVIEKHIEDADLVQVSSNGINENALYRGEDMRSTETEKSEGGRVVTEEKYIPDVDRRYVGTENVYSKEDKQVDQRKEQEREEARRRYIMQQMGGRDY